MWYGFRFFSHSQDSGKSLHGEHRDYTMVDFNRAGVPLLEIITDPDLKYVDQISFRSLYSTSLEACEFIKKITYLLMHIGVCLSEVGGEVRSNIISLLNFPSLIC